MDKDTEKLLSSSHDARLVHLNEQLVFPLLERRIQNQVDRLCQDFEAGKPVNPNSIAAIVACRNLRIELESISRRGEAAVIKLHNKGDL